MNKLLLLWLFTLSCFVTTSHLQAQKRKKTKIFTVPTQRNCGFENSNNWHDGKKQAQLIEIEQLIQAKTSERLSAGNRTKMTYQIPVIVHVIHNGEPIGEGANISAAQVYSQIDVLNEDFSGTNADTANVRDIFKDRIGNIGVTFVIATHDPDGMELPEPGITRYNGGSSDWSNTGAFDSQVKTVTSWNARQYANFWTADLGGQLLGYAQFPTMGIVDGLLPTESEDTDGVVMGHRYFGSANKVTTSQLSEAGVFNLGRTATHEVGHWLGLRHIWGDGGCGVDDYVTDTPNSGGSNGGCPSDSQNTCTDASDDEPDMWENYMDYTNDACMYMFSTGQEDRMQTVLDNDPLRNDLINSDVPVSDVPRDPFVVASFDYETSFDVCSGTNVLTVDFNSDSYIALSNSEQITGYSWTFEGADVGSSTQENPTVTYSTAGTYDVTLTVTSTIGSKTITIEDAIVVDLSIFEPSILPFTEDFESFDTNASGWEVADEWLTVDLIGRNSSSSVYVDNYNNSFDGFESDLVTSVLNTQGFDSIQVSFDISYTFYEDGPDVFTDSLRLSLQTCDGVTSFWQKGGQELSTTGSGLDDLFTPSSDADWRRETITMPVNSDISAVVFTNIGYYGNTLFIDNISVIGLIEVFTMDLGDDIVSCESVDIAPAVQSADSYAWYVSGNNTIIGTNPTLTVDNSGEYVLVGNKNGTEASDTILVTINDAEGTISSFDITSVTNRTVSLTNTSSNADSYSWDLGDDNTNTTESPTHTYDNYGDYTITLTAYSLCGEISSDKTVTLVELVTNIGDDQTVCESVELSAMGVWENVTYSWVKEGETTVLGTEQAYTAIESGNYVLTMTGYGQTVSDTVSVTVKQTPVADFTYEVASNNISVSFTNTSTHGDDYSWSFGDGNTSTTESPTHTYSVFDAQEVTLIANSSICESASVTKTIPNGVLSLSEDASLSNQLVVFPNPNEGQFSFSLPNVKFQSASIELIDLTGKVVWKKTVDNLTNQDIEISASAGIYLLKLNVDNKFALKRVVIK
ncbi:MAG: PKD repeat protein [Flammeovirgaceae bacterium]|jgi:PKD repeat protein